MKHPFTGNKNLYYYLSVWAIIAGVHTAYLFYAGNVRFFIALNDSLVFNSLLCGLGLSYWYMVRFTNIEGKQSSNSIVSHAIGIVTVVTFAVFMSQFILKLFFKHNYAYLEFLSDSIIWRFFLATLYLLNTILIYYLIRYYRGLQEKLEIAGKLQTMVKEAELDMLKSQINPHFIFNSLNSISALTITAPEKARDMVIRLSSFLRYSLGKGSNEQNSLEEEMTNILLYLDIEKVRFGDRLHIQSEIAKDSNNAQVPNMILQPIFENAIKYGVYENLGKVDIQVRAFLKNKTLIVQVTNNFDPEGVPRKGKGIGLKNIQERLRLIYNQSDLLHVEKREDTFIATLSFPQNI